MVIVTCSSIVFRFTGKFKLKLAYSRTLFGIKIVPSIQDVRYISLRLEVYLIKYLTQKLKSTSTGYYTHASAWKWQTNTFIISCEKLQLLIPSVLIWTLKTELSIKCYQKVSTGFDPNNFRGKFMLGNPVTCNRLHVRKQESYLANRSLVSCFGIQTSADSSNRYIPSLTDQMRPWSRSSFNAILILAFRLW